MHQSIIFWKIAPQNVGYFSTIFVADTKIIFACNFEAPLKYNLDSLYFFTPGAQTYKQLSMSWGWSSRFNLNVVEFLFSFKALYKQDRHVLGTVGRAVLHILRKCSVWISILPNSLFVAFVSYFKSVTLSTIRPTMQKVLAQSAYTCSKLTNFA